MVIFKERQMSDPTDNNETSDQNAIKVESNK